MVACATATARGATSASALSASRATTARLSCRRAARRPRAAVAIQFYRATTAAVATAEAPVPNYAPPVDGPTVDRLTQTAGRTISVGASPRERPAVRSARAIRTRLWHLPPHRRRHLPPRRQHRRRRLPPRHQHRRRRQPRRSKPLTARTTRAKTAGRAARGQQFRSVAVAIQLDGVTMGAATTAAAPVPRSVPAVASGAAPKPTAGGLTNVDAEIVRWQGATHASARRASRARTARMRLRASRRTSTIHPIRSPAVASA